MLFAHLGALQGNLNMEMALLFPTIKLHIYYTPFIFSSCSSGLRLTSNTYQTLIPLRKDLTFIERPHPKILRPPSPLSEAFLTLVYMPQD